MSGNVPDLSKALQAAEQERDEDYAELRRDELADFIRDQVCCPRIHGCELNGSEDCPAEKVRSKVSDLETAVLNAALSDRVDDAGSPLSWQEIALSAERQLGEVRGVLEEALGNVADGLRAWSCSLADARYPDKVSCPPYEFALQIEAALVSLCGVGGEEASVAESVSEGLRPFACETPCQSDWWVECEGGDLPQVRQTTERTWITWSPTVSAFGMSVPVTLLRRQAEVIRNALANSVGSAS